VAETAAELIVDVKAKESVTAVLKRLETGLEQSNSSAERLARALEAQLARGQNKAKNEALAHAQAEARLKAASGDLAGAIRTLNQALQGVDRNSQAAIRAETQLVQMQRRLAQETHAAETALKRQGSGMQSLFKGGAGAALQFAGALGLATTAMGAAMAVINRAEEGFKLRATLDEQRRSIGTLLGDVQRGNQVFAEAAAFGRKYGFTQKEMGQSAEEAADLIRKSTVATQQQLEVLGRLASRNSQQGFSGAVLSAKELSTGDITSIVERFNVARSAARAMKEEIANGADVFVVLDKYLNSVGATTDVLSNRMLGAAGSLRTYAQAQEDLTLAMGAFAEGPGKQVLDILTKMTNGLTGSLTIGDQTNQAAQQALAGAQTFEQYGQRVAFVNEQLGGLRQQFGLFGPAFAAMVQPVQALTEAQFNYAQSLMQQGVASDQAFAKAQALAPTFERIATVQEFARTRNVASQQALEQLSATMVNVAATVPNGAAAVDALAVAFYQGQITATEFQAHLDAIVAANTRVAQASEQAAQGGIYQSQAMRDAAAAGQEANTALSQLIGEMEKSAQESIVDAEAKRLQAELTRQLQEEANAAVNEFLRLNPTIDAAGVASLQAAGKIDPFIGQLAQLRLEAAKTASTIVQMNSILAGGAGGLLPKGLTERGPSAADRFGAGAGSSEAGEALRIQALINAAFPTVETGRKGRSGGGGSKVSDQQKLHNQLLADQEKFQSQYETAELEHAKRRLEIEEDFAEKRLQAEENFRSARLDSEASFYDALGQITDHGLQQAYSAQYEAALLEAEQLAREKGYDVGQAYMEAKEAALKAQMQREQEIKDAEAEGDTNKAEYLRGVDEKYRAAEERKIELAKQGNDSIAQQHQQALSDEALRYEEAQGKIAEASDRATEQKINNAIRSGKAIDTENLALERQAKLLDQIGGQSSARSGAPVAAPASSAAPASGTPTASDPAQASAGDLQKLITAVEEAKAAIEAVERATRDGAREVSGAVRTSSNGRHVQ
jgi:hypothetical protein